MEKFGLDLIIHFFKNIITSIFSRLSYKKQVWWTKFISTITCGGFLCNIIPTNYIFNFKGWLCKNDFMNTIYSKVRPLWKGDAAMLAFIINFIVITIVFLLLFSLYLKLNPNIIKRFNLQKEIESIKTDCKTKQQYEVRKKRLLEDYSSLENVEILFEENWQVNEIILKYSFKKEELLKISFFVSNEEEEYYNQLTIKLEKMIEDFSKLDISNIKENIYPYLCYELHIIPCILQNKVIIEIVNTKTQALKVITINK